MPVAEPSLLYDQGNELLTPGPANLYTGIVDTPAGQKMGLTIRTPSTTLTVFLSRDEAEAWSGQLMKDAAKMSKGGLIVASPGVAVRNTEGNGDGQDNRQR